MVFSSVSFLFSTKTYSQSFCELNDEDFLVIAPDQINHRLSKFTFLFPR